MHRCPQCKTEYEGKFCPECGAPWQEEKTCPQCGATLSGRARFCNECGYAFVSTPPAQPALQQTAPKPHDPAIAQKAYAILRYVPMALLALFAVLLFAFAAAPVAVMVNPFGGKNIGLGNIYGSYREDLPELNGIVIALWISIALALLYAAVTVFLFFRKETKYKDINLFGKFRMGLGEAFGMGGFVFYLLFLILSAVTMGKLKALDDGLGLLKAGSSPILVMVFSILFALMAAGALTARYLLNKKNPQLGLEEAQRKLNALIAEEERKKAFFATHTPPVPPVLATNAKGKEKRAYKIQCVAYKHNKRRYEKAKEGNAAAGVVWLDRHKTPLITVAVFIIAVAVFLSIFLPWYFNIFRVGVVEKIDIGDGTWVVEDVLGEPYAGTKTDEKWEYYDKETAKLLKKYQDKATAAEEAMLAGNLAQAEKYAAEADSLAEKLAKRTYDYIEIRFDSDYRVKSVLLALNINGSEEEPKAKKVKKLTIEKESVIPYYEDKTVSEDARFFLDCTLAGNDKGMLYNARYTDGSFYRGAVENATITEWQDTQAIITWHDYFATYTVTNKTLKVGTVDEEGAWSTNSKNIRTITLPASVVSIINYAFDSLRSIAVSENNPNYSSQDGILYNKEKTKFVIIPEDLRGAITIPQGITSIGNEAFEWRGVTSITIPSSVTSIGYSAFAYCSGLTGIEIPSSVTSIGGSAFIGCSGLTGIEIPSSVTSIEGYAFYGCSGLTSIEIPSGVTSIGGSAFSGCSGLTSIEIPSGVTSIGDRAFSGCSGLTSIEIPSSVTSIRWNVFEGCSSLTSLTVASGNSKYYSAGNCIIETESKTLIVGCKASVIPADGSIMYIGYSAFAYCSGLTSITIPNSVTSIESSAFYNCSSLTSITIPQGVTSIGYSAFAYCSGLKDIYCEAASEPSGWDRYWKYECSATVHWGC